MKHSKSKILLFAGTMLVIIAVPIFLIVRSQLVLTDGDLFRFRSRPIDPTDILRGKYITLRFDDRSAEWMGDDDSYKGQTIYVTVEKDEEGYAFFDKAYPDIPDNQSYIETRVKRKSFWGSSDAEREVHFKVPFRKYYLNEEFAQLAEDEYNRLTRASSGSVFVDVRIQSGNAVIEEVYMNDQPIMEYLKSLEE
jgi:uncharacterized membrane-anchored protein